MELQPNMFARQNGDNTQMANLGGPQKIIGRTNLSPSQSRKLLM